MKRLLFACLFSAFLFGCATFQQMATYTVNAVKIAQSIKYVEANLDETLQEIYGADFYTDNEKAAINQMSLEIDDLLIDVKKVIGPGLDVETLVAVSEIDKLILSSRNIYSEMYSIISNHYQEFSPQAQKQLSTLDNNLVAMDKTWRSMVENSESGDVTPILKTMLNATKAAATIVSLAPSN